MLYLAISGKMYSGKTTVANMLQERFPDLIIWPFAKGLKQYAKEIFNVETDGPNKNRHVLQTFGTEVCRHIDEDCWVNLLLRQWEAQKRPNIVIDDLRFRNEASLLLGNGFNLIRVETPVDIRLERAYALGTNISEEAMKHESEVALDDCHDIFSYKIDNDGSMEDLKERVRTLEYIIRTEYTKNFFI